MGLDVLFRAQAQLPGHALLVVKGQKEAWLCPGLLVGLAGSW